MAVTEFNHVGVIVDDLDLVADFFELIGLERGEKTAVSGEWADRVNGLTGTQVEMVWMSLPGGGTALELSSFRAPERGIQPNEYALQSNAHGYRHLCFGVDDVDAVITRAAEAGYGLERELVNYEGIFRLAYLRGPEGLIVEVSERL